MSYNKASFLSFILFGLIGMLTFLSARGFTSTSDINVRADFFPKAVSILLIISCSFGFFKVLKSNDKKVDFGNIKLILYSIIILMVFIVIWQFTSAFYLPLFASFVILFYLYRQERFSYKMGALTTLYSLIVSVVIFLIFDVILGISF